MAESARNRLPKRILLLRVFVFVQGATDRFYKIEVHNAVLRSSLGGSYSRVAVDRSKLRITEYIYKYYNKSTYANCGETVCYNLNILRPILLGVGTLRFDLGIK